MKKLIFTSVFVVFIGLIVNAATHTSSGNGYTTDVGIPNTPGNGDVINIGYPVVGPPVDTARHIVSTYNADFDFSQGGTLNVYGNFTVNGNFSAGNNLIINIYHGGSLTITGNLTTVNNLTLNVSGSLVVNGSTTSNNGADITVNNTGTADLGNVTFNNNGTLQVDGSVTAGAISFAQGGTISVPSGGYLEATSATFTGGGTFTNNGTINIPANSITVNGTVTTPSGGGSNLPIRLTNFIASSTENTVKITWQTASEENNDYFTLERSADGVNYEIIGTVKGAGNSCVNLNYSYTDNYPLNGVSYYRLSQTDYDGKFEVFAPVSVSLLNEGDLKVGPNPVVDYLNVSLGANTGSYSLDIYNIIGARVKNMELSQSFATVDVSELPKGQYIVVITANDNRLTKKIVVQ